MWQVASAIEGSVCRRKYGFVTEVYILIVPYFLPKLHLFFKIFGKKSHLSC
jgi:hypothetical protein